MSNNQFEFLDILAIVSFILQVQNQNKIIDISDIQDELHKVVSEIHKHLETQDDKIDKIISRLEDIQ